MSCNNIGVILDGDSKGTIKKCLENAFRKRAYDEIIIASYFEDNDFINALNQAFDASFKVGQIAEIAKFIETGGLKNQFSGFIRNYYDNHVRTINCTIKQRQSSNLKGFVNESAKGKAIRHTASELQRKEQENGYLPKNERRNSDQIIKSIKNDLFDETFRIIADHIRTFKNVDNESINKAKKLFKLKGVIVNLGSTGELNNNTEEVNNKLIDVLKNVADITGLAYDSDKNNIINPITKEVIIDFSTTKSLGDSLDRYIEFQIIDATTKNILEQGTNIEKNRIALFKNVLYNTNEWFKEVFRISDVVNLQKQYEKTLESEKINEFNILDEMDEYDEDKASIDEFAKNWDDALPKDYTKLFSSKLKLLLGNLYRLSGYAEDNNNIPYTLDEDLGVRTRENVNYLISQIATSANRSSANAFLKSLELLARQNASLYSLSVLVNQLKKDQDLLHYVYSQFDKQVISKIIINVTVDDIINCSQSNTASDPVLSNFYIFTNSAKFNYKTAYDSNDFEFIKQAVLSPNRAEQLDKVLHILTKYFPNIDIDAIYSYLNSQRQNDLDGTIKEGIRFDKEKPFKNLLVFTQQFLQAVNNVSSNEQDIRSLTNERIAQWEKGDKKTERPRFDYNDVNYSSWNRPISNLCNLLKDFYSVKVQLNSVNAEGNMSSDLIKNSFITRLLQQIKYSDNTDSQKGLEILKEFVTRNYEYYKYSPIFYGVKDANGRIIHEGLFDRDEFGNVSVNPKAKELIDISLFDGGKNDISDKRAGYSKMSDKDYFLTQIITYNHPQTNGLVSIKAEKFGGYFLTTPSDAPKNFVFRFFKYNQNNAKSAVHAHLYSELNRFIDNLNNLFEVDKKGNFILRDDVENLFDRAHYKSLEDVDGNTNNYLIDTRKKIKTKDDKIINNPDYGKLVGHFFQFQKLYETNGYKASEDIIQQLSLYGGANENSLITISRGKISLNINHPLLTIRNNKISLKVDNNTSNILNSVVDKWVENYITEAKERINNYKHLLTERFTDNQAIDAMIGHTIMNMNYDDILIGAGVYYKNAQDLLKRAKEIQAGGETYSGTDFNDPIGGEIIEKDVIAVRGFTWKQNPNAQLIKFKNGFRAVTIKNTVRKSEHVVQIEEDIYKSNVDKLGDKEARRIAHEIAKGYGSNTAMNDAQSYITIEEFIARKYADGTIDEYVDILQQLQEVKEGKRDIKDLDISEVNARIQVQKNFYYDIQFDPITNCYYPRQIKNAEFVLIPELLKGTDLLDLYNTMTKYNIGQVNTAETSKAAKRNILTFWDNQGVAHNEDFIKQLEQDNLVSVENYYYKYLYKQQDVADHIQDTENKAGLQITRVIQNNIDTNTYPELKEAVDRYIKNYCANIEYSFNKFLYQNGWKQEGDKIVNLDGSEDLDFKEFREKAKREVARLGLNKNFNDYLEADETGHPKMPNFTPLVASKLESIAQAMFNNAITRQKLPGWHGAQVTSIGHGVKAKTDDGSMRSLQYHPEVYKLKEDNKVSISKEEYSKLSKEEQDKYELKSEAYAEILIPRWSKLIEKEVTIEELADAGLDMQIGYRIPTEGKQSVSVFKVVGFLDDVYGSTVMVPDEWVIQTGSDFDVDSIYAMTYEMRKNKETGKLEKIELDDDKSEKGCRRRYERYVQDMLNEKLKDLSEMRIVSDERQELIDKYKELVNELKNNKYSFEEFKDIKEEQNKTKKEIEENIKKRYKTAEQLARRGNLMSYQNFIELSIEEQNTQAARNNEILKSYIDIMSHESTREENYSRSNFDDLADVIKHVMNLMGLSSKAVSHYNAFDQLINMRNAMSGRELKGILVNRDGFNSICNRAKAQLREDLGIPILYDLEQYDIEVLKAAYGDDVQIIDKVIDGGESVSIPITINDLVCHSGGAYGADFNWAKIGEEFGISKTNAYYVGQTGPNNAPYGNTRMSDKDYKEANKEIVAAAKHNFGFQYSSINDEKVRRDWAQVKYADAVFAVGTIVQPGMHLFPSNSKDARIAQNPTVAGGTSYAVTMAILHNKPVYVFDQNENKWFKYDFEVNNFVEMQTIPVLTKNFAGIGDTDITDEGIQAIKDIYQHTKEYYEILSSVNANYKKPTIKKYAKINHRRWAWSKNNRNVIGKLITTYGSQTVAHILDVMKEGAIYNENTFTVGVFKTLTDLGSDFNHSVAFLAQPAVSQIVKNFEANNSIYIKDKVNEIRKAFADILGVDNKYISDSDINDIVMNDSNLKKAYLELFKEDYENAKDNSEKEDFKITDFIYPITLEMLENRLQGKEVINNSIFNPAEKEYRDKIFDLIILNNFNHINRITKNVEKLAKCANADKLGADQTVKSTRDIYDDIKTYIDPENNMSTVLECDGVPFLEAMYPGIITSDDINVESSVYPYQAAFLKCATIPSIKINSILFTLENQRYVQITRELERRLGKKLTLAEYKEFKNYLVASRYKDIQFLNAPITISNGMPCYNTKLMAEMTAQDEDYVTQEYLRIQGFDIYGAKSFEVKDFNNPTTKELNEFLKLTPAQKVAWLQANLNTSKRETYKGIFKYIIININNRKSAKGNYQQAILKINDQVDDINVLIQEFENSYYNSNPFIQLAAIDLIKYSFLVEGFTFKRGNISKIISNVPLYEDHINKGTNIISDLQNSLSSYINVEELLDCYFRSHSGVINKLFLDKPIKANSGLITVKTNKAIKDNTTVSGLVKIPFNEDTKEVIKLILNKQSANHDYINIVRWVDKITDKVDKQGNPIVDYTQKEILYKIDTIGETLVLIPLNKLEQNEYGEFSNNPNNNEFYNESQYRIELSGTDEGYVDKRNKFIPNNGKIAILENKGNIIGKLLKSKKTADKYKAEILIKNIENALRDENGDITNVGIFVNPLYELQEEIHVNKKSIQEIKLNSSKETVKIEKFNIDKKLIKFINENINSGEKLSEKEYNKLSPNNRKIYDLFINYRRRKESAAINQLLSHSYVVTKIINDSNVASLERAKNEAINNNIEEDNVREASTSLLDDISIETGLEKNSTDKVAQSIVNEVNRRIKSGKERGNDTLSEKFMKDLARKGLDYNSFESIKSNKKNIYASAATYYVQRGKQLLNDINEFETVTGLKFSIDSDEFYDYLLDHREDYLKLVDLLLEAKTFGKLINDIFNLNITGEDTITQNAIEQIRFAINSVINNQKLLVAQEKIYNNYMTNAVSTNPNLVNHIVKMRDVFGDTDFFDRNLSAITELDNKQVQAVIKYVLTQSTKAEMFDAPKAQKDFEKLWNDIEKMDGTLDMSKLIDKHGIRIKKFDQKFLDEYKRIYKELEEAEKKYGKYSKEYIKASLARDEFRFRNLHQELVPEYYIAKWKNESAIFREAPNLYIEWKKLNDELYQNIEGDITEEDEQKRREAIWDKIRNLMSEQNADGTEKDFMELANIEALKDFIQKKKNIDKKYFTTDTNDIFKDTVKYYADIVDNYEKAHKHESLEQRLKNTEYRQAYNWLKNNGRFILDAESSNKVKKAFDEIREKGTSTQQDLINRILKKHNAYDAYGVIDARKIPAEDLEVIRKIQNERFNEYETAISTNRLIKVVPANLPPISSKFWDMFRDSSKESKTGKERLAAINAINAILSKGLDKDSGIISTKLLWENTTADERAELAFQYNELTRLTEERKAKFEAIRRWKKDKGVTIVERPSFEEHADVKLNEEAYNTELTYAQNNLSASDLQVWYAIFAQRDAHGNFIKDGDSYVPNSDIYGYIMPKDDKYIDHKKKDALDILNNAVEFVPTEYYYEAIKEATADGTFNEWFEANHVYNPYKRRYEPLKIWTTMKVKPYEDIKAEYEYDATYEHKIKAPKEEFKNPEYKENGKNYNYTPQTVSKEKIGGLYNNPTKLNPKEQAMLDLIEHVLDTYTKGHKAKRFIDNGYMPRRIKTKKDGLWVAKQGLSLLGLNMGNPSNKEYTDDLNYLTDYETDQPMLELLKAKGYKEPLKLPIRSSYSNEEEYKKELNKVREENEKIRQENLKLESEILDNNWKDVLKEFIANAVVHNAKQESKNTLYLLLEDLKDNKAYKIHPVTGKLVRDSASSTVEEDSYKTIDQSNTYDLVENWIKRFVKNQFKKQSAFTKYANLMQNITSAKYMSFNIVGGVANINTGLVNMFNEYFSKQYFDKGDFIAAQSAYLLNSLGFIANMYNDKAPNLTIGLTKLFDIVDYGKIKDDSIGDDIETTARRIRDSFYGFQTGGEHYMQNVVLLSMLKSNKIYKDSDGKVKFGGLSEYQWDREIKAMLNVLSGDRELLTRYKLFISDIKNDLNEVKDYDRFAKDLNKEFLKEVGDKKVIQDYIKERDKLLEEAKKEFNELPSLESQFKLVDGKAVIKPNSEFTEEMAAQFKTKVKVVNDKIHGVYDKMGGARIEREWWGALVMQYHKHIYPGIMKRWRRKGYYNEIRNSVEKGSYISMIQFLGTEFMNIKDKVTKRMTEDNENVALASIQVVTKSLIDSFINIKMNWQIMPEWERANCRRVLGDLAGVIAAIAIPMLIYAAGDDDEIEDSNFWATCIHLGDRLYSESIMYTPSGLYTEASTLWSSPIATMNTYSDAFKLLSISTNMLFDKDFDPIYSTGLYRGQHKAAVMLYRNIPVYRIYNRLSHMNENNSYYRLNDSRNNIKFSKNIANIISED